jgi:RND family efflux transporter MFP subunit
MCTTCSKPGSDANEKVDAMLLTSTTVEVQTLKGSTFNKELISNGKLSAIRKSIIPFRVSGQLTKIHFKNGDFVSKGNAIAELADRLAEEKLIAAGDALKKARFDLQDQLFGRNFDLKDSLVIPPDVLEMAAIRSGYYEALHRVRIAKSELSFTTLRAPFSGKIANLEKRVYEFAKEGEPFCTVVDDKYLQGDFFLMESELHQIHVKDKVLINPFQSDHKLSAEVISINPTINENGMVLVNCKVENDGHLVDGMNVHIKVLKPFPNSLVVPKRAVINRDNQKVIFKFVKGKAYWVYIEIVDENSDTYSVRAHSTKAIGELQEGDTIIVSGNTNLAHDTRVLIGQHQSE